MIIGLTETGGISLITVFVSSTALVLVAIIGQRQKQVHQQATKDRKLLQENTQDIKNAVKPVNGYDTLGGAVEAIEEHLVRIDTRLVEGEARFERIESEFRDRGGRIDKLEEKSAETLHLVAENHGLFKNYIEAWTPLAARAVGEWGPDGTKEKRGDHGRRRDK